MFRHQRILILFICFTVILQSKSQLYQGSNFLTALRGYNPDVCRFVSCPFGQYCINGICTASVGGVGNGDYSGLSTYGGMGGYGGGAFGGNGLGYGGIGSGGYGAVSTYDALETASGLAAGISSGSLGSGQLCAETEDCIAGQYCQQGRCVSSLTSSMYGDGQILTGVQTCTLMQDCLNGQICVNGFCSQSNVAYMGSQLMSQRTSCSSGAVCPIGQYCISGVCVQNMFSSTFACAGLTTCPPGMICQLGRCIPNGLGGLAGIGMGYGLG
uniref:EB domain-containing protein n=1 Tax=Panagrellus redivivus TaxID=6233 RepID=A0A7E4UZU3_PANRE